jgi:DNA (cytosine-5)-methyltransferase 1
MPARVYYNEHDPFAAAWLRQLIAQNLIAPGDVDERSIEDVLPSDLDGYIQCHFFAGIGGWSYALRLAGWPDDRPVWTGSCPCQPFSTAGKGAGTVDERHLWPAWQWLIRQCRPDLVFGEQVEAAINHGWFDVVSTDLEGEGYAVGAGGLPSAGIGAPHIRQRLYFVAHTTPSRCQGLRRSRKEGVAQHRNVDKLADPRSKGRRQVSEDTGGSGEGSRAQGLVERSLHGGDVNSGLGDPSDTERDGWSTPSAGPSRIQHAAITGGSGRLANADGGDAEAEGIQRGRQHRLGPEDGVSLRGGTEGRGDRDGGELERPSPTNGFWGSPDWLYCRDGKWRPVEPGTFPLAHGAPARVGRLRGYGNSINPYVAQAFIESYLDATSACRPLGGSVRGREIVGEVAEISL